MPDAHARRPPTDVTLLPARYWVVQVHEVKDEEAYGVYVGKFVEAFVQTGKAKVLHLAKPSAVFEAGKEENVAIVEFESLEAAIACKESKEYAAAIAASGKTLDELVHRDFRLVELPEGWLRPGKGYWQVSVHAIKDADGYGAYVGKFVEGIVKKGLFGVNVIYLGKPAKIYEAGIDENVALVEFESVEVAKAVKTSPEYVACLDGKDPTDLATRDMRVIGV